MAQVEYAFPIEKVHGKLAKSHKILPPVVVKYLCEKYDIDLE